MKFIPQFDSLDCGSACLAMIFKYYGLSISSAVIRDIAGTDKAGTNFKGLIKCGEENNFSCKALKGSPDFFNSNLPTPFIAHVEPSFGVFHFVVVSEISEKYVRILDPADVPKKILKSEFLKNWTGYAIFLSPNSDFKPQAASNGKLLRFLPLFKPHIKTMLQVILSSFLLTILGIVGSFYFSYLVDEVLPSKAESALHILGLGMVLLTLFQVVLGVIRGQMLLHFSMKTSMALNFTYLKHIVSLSLKFFDSRKVGEILSRFDDGNKIRGLLSSAALSIVMDVLMMVGSIGFLISINATLFGLALAVVPLSTGVMWMFAKFFRENYRTSMTQGADSQSFLVEALNGMSTIKGLGASQQVFNEIERKIMKVTNTGYKGAVMGNIQGVLVGLIDGWGANILFWVGSWFILKDSMSLGNLMAFNALLAYFLGPLKRLLGLQPAIQEALVAADRLGEILELEPEIKTEQKLLQPARFSGKIEVQNILFRYGNRRPILEDCTLTIEAGTKVAFVGPSGCGKSSFIKLLLKFYTAEKGEILLDGNNLKDLDTLHLRLKTGYVPQEVFLFSGSIRENLSLHKPDASFEEIVAAAQRAQAHEFITELPERYDTILAERGSSLSGGERQRLALARALLGRPEILIFDEATSNLDVITEKAVHETIRELANEGLTTILVAHRLSTVVSCDQIFVMEKGRIVESGSHFELVKKGGAYTKLWEYQKL